MIGRRKAQRRARKKKCEHFEKVAAVCQRVLDGEVPYSVVGYEHLAEEYLLLHLEFEALRTHLSE